MNLKSLRKNNRIIIEKYNLNVICLFIFSKIIIKGKNNTIVFRGNFKFKNYFNILRGLNVRICGDNNIIDIEFPIKIKRVKISIVNDNNMFKIGSTPNLFADANFDIGDGSSVIIGKNSEIYAGNLYCVAKHNYSTPHKLIIGDECYIAKDTIIRTSDGQTFLDPKTGEPLGEPQDITIGNHVWLMSRCMIVKGTEIPDGCAVAPYSFVNKKFQIKNAFIAGIPASIKKENILWSIDSYRNARIKYEESEAKF